MLSVLRIVENFFAPFLHQVTAEAVGTEALFLIKNEYIHVLEEQCAAFPQLILCFIYPIASPDILSDRTGWGP